MPLQPSRRAASNPTKRGANDPTTWQKLHHSRPSLETCFNPDLSCDGARCSNTPQHCVLCRIRHLGQSACSGPLGSDGSFFMLTQTASRHDLMDTEGKFAEGSRRDPCLGRDMSWQSTGCKLSLQLPRPSAFHTCMRQAAQDARAHQRCMESISIPVRCSCRCSCYTMCTQGIPKALPIVGHELFH